MEKFAVDLDAVLDEFEYHEGQASLQGANQSPSVTGFFSPTTEEATSLASTIIQSPSLALSGHADIASSASPSPPSAASVRYDLPKSPPPPSHFTELLQPVETQHQQGNQQLIVDENEEDGGEETVGGDVAARPGVSYSRQQTREDTSSLVLGIQPQEVIVDENSGGVPTKEDEGVQPKASLQESRAEVQQGASDHSDGESHKTKEIDTCVDDSVEQMEPKLEETSIVQEGTGQGERSLQEEMQEVERGAGVHECSTGSPGRSGGTGRREDDYVAQEEVEGYLARMKEEGENYVDENQVTEYLRQLQLEKSEEELLALCPEEDSEEEESREGEVLEEEDVAAPEVGLVEAPVALASVSQFIHSDDPKGSDQRLTSSGTGEEVEYSPATVLETLGTLESELEPVIPSQNAVETEARGGGNTGFYQEEAEYVDLGPDGLDLVPQIESPPPYSEVDPRLLPRPTSLPLQQEEISTAVGEQENSLAVVGPPGATPSNPNGPRDGTPDPLAGLSEEQLLLGRVQPFWVPDADAPDCMICNARFTLVKRRHHCRACGKVLCAACCNEKHSLVYLENKEGRVCTPCRTVLARLEGAAGQQSSGLATPPPPADPAASLGARPRPNPANPMEYCSTVPVADQVAAASGSRPPPSVMVPVGVLKRASEGEPDRSGSSASVGQQQGENKSVMFSDGIRPGGDLTELDGRGPEHRTLGRRPGRGRSSARRQKARGPAGAQDVAASLLPETGLPLVSGRGSVDEEEVLVWFSAGTYVSFVMNKNLSVVVKRLHYPPANKLCWNFATRGLTSVGQDEVVVLLEVQEEEQLPPREVFTMLQALYEQAGAGSLVAEMGHVTVGHDYLGSSSHGGWLFIRHSHQTVADLLLPPPPLLFAVLIMRWEVPWARVAPLRLMLRLGAEFRYYPAPLVSVRGRKPVYGEIGHTIMNVLADFKNYTYALPTIGGLVIHMSPGTTSILIPKNRYDSIVKALNTSNETVLALGANFSHSADSHLVAMQGEDGSYQTQAINIQNKERMVTGASFVVFNGALKSTANLTAKSSIVEDGLMVQVLPDNMGVVRKALREMQPHVVACGPVGAEKPDEVVSIVWVDEDKAFNIGIKSVLDGKPMDGISSLRIHSGPDMTQDRCLIRWTEVFLINTGERPGATTNGDAPAPARAAEGIARAVSVALLPHLQALKEEGLTPLAVRVTLDQDNVQYEAGAGGSALPSTFTPSLDNELVPLLHSGSLAPGPLSLELLFHILDH